MSAPTCPNCARVHARAVDVCMLQAMAGLLVDDGYTHAEALRIVQDVNVDAFWKEMRELLDDMVDGDL